MHCLQVLGGDCRIHFELIHVRAVEPDAVFADARNQRVVSKAAHGLDERNRPAAAQRDDWTVLLHDSQSVVLSNFRQRGAVNRSVGLR